MRSLLDTKYIYILHMITAFLVIALATVYQETIHCQSMCKFGLYLPWGTVVYDRTYSKGTNPWLTYNNVGSFPSLNTNIDWKMCLLIYNGRISYFGQFSFPVKIYHLGLTLSFRCFQIQGHTFVGHRYQFFVYLLK